MKTITIIVFCLFVIGLVFIVSVRLGFNIGKEEEARIVQRLCDNRAIAKMQHHRGA